MIKEVENIPEDQFSFRATPETRTSLDEAEACMNSYGDKLDETMTRLDGKSTSKEAFLTFAMSHEGYHRGQLTVFERLLNIEPVLTNRTKKLFANSS